MTCLNCGSPLPAGALFCGECGRAVARSVVEPKPVTREQVQPDPVPPPRGRSTPVEPPPVEPDEVEPDEVEPDKVEPEQLEPDEVEPEQVEPDEFEHDEVEHDEVEQFRVERPRLQRDEVDPPRATRFFEPLLSNAPVANDAGHGVETARTHDAAETELDTCDQCGAVIGPLDIFCGECGHVSRSVSSAFSGTRNTVAIEPIPLAAPEKWSLEPRGESRTASEAELSEEQRAHPHRAASHARGRLIRPSDDDIDDDLADLEATRIVAGKGRGERFVVQFSTGESVTIFGTGLIGRNPMPEPGEYFDQLVRVLDPTRSVSKTHLEFGQESGAFWIFDRYSGNGTVIREPERTAFRCDPGKRYRVARGSRIDIGEQFFVVS